MPQGVRRRKFKANHKRDKRLGEIKYDEQGKQIDDRNTEAGKNLGYKDIVRENSGFVQYYQAQTICPPDEFQQMLDTLKSDLPSSFRITGFRSQSRSLLKIIEGQYFKELTELAKEGKVVMPECLEWYPDRMAYQLNLTRKEIRREEAYFKLHNFLVGETETGNTSRQETVSMIPPLVLDVKPHHKVLDMCAAPGSKTAQLIEALHAEDEAGVLPTGFVVANDADNARCYMLTHQAKRLQSPAVIITNHDAAIMPNFMVKKKGVGNDGGEVVMEKEEPLRFDRILCDVPCTGDGTMRKNPDIWPKWNPSNGTNLHGIQYRILKRGVELLEIGGQLVYSTCSLNPVEDEAVICRMLKDAGGSLELVDITGRLPGLKYSPGVTTWQLSGKEVEMYKKWEEVPESVHCQVRPQMFPPPPEEVEQYNLQRCIRVLPHHQNTGGFFVALLQKNKLCPWEAERKERKATYIDKETGEEKLKDTVFNPPPNKKRFFGFKEDPFIYIREDDPEYPPIEDYFGLKLSHRNFLHRSRDETKKKTNLYFTTLEVREIVENNLERMKIINTGVKAFTRCENKGAECDFRIAQEGALSIINFLRKRILHPTRDDLELMLQSSDFEVPPLNSEMTHQFQEELEAMSTGSVAFVFEEPLYGEKFKVEIVGWKGKNTVRAYVPKNERLHYLRLIGGDISKFETNKFEEKEKRKQERAKNYKSSKEEKSVEAEETGEEEENGGAGGASAKGENEREEEDGDARVTKKAKLDGSELSAPL